MAKLQKGTRVKVNNEIIGVKGEGAIIEFSRGLLGTPGYYVDMDDTSQNFTFNGTWCAEVDVEEIESSDIKPGDVVKVTGHSLAHSLNIGTLAKVESVDDDGDLDLRGVSSYGNGLKKQFVQPHAVEPVSDYVKATRDGLDLTEGQYYEVVSKGVEGIVVIDDALERQRLARHEYEDPTKYKAGDIVEGGTGAVYKLKHRKPDNDDLGYGKAWIVDGEGGWIGEHQIAGYADDADFESTKGDDKMTKFERGDKIIVTEPGGATGKVFTLEGRREEFDVSGRGKAWTVEETFGWLGEDQFELYEEDETDAEDEHGFNAGDRVYAESFIYTGTGTIASREAHGYLIDTDEPHMGGRLDGLLWVADSMVTSTTEKAEAFKIGDEVEVTGRNGGTVHFFDVGTTGEIISGPDRDGDFLVKSPNERDTQWISPQELRLTKTNEIEREDVVEFLSSKDAEEVLEIIAEVTQ